VPNVGWVFIQRLPVRKQAGRETAATLRRAKSTRTAMRPMPVPKSPPPSSRATATAVRSQATNAKSGAATKSAQPPKLNDLTTFLNFVEKNPIGTKAKGSVDSYASHGVYVKIGEVSGYLPLRLMASPTPRSAREHVKLGASLNLVVVGFTPSRRSVELAVSGMETLAQKTVAKSASGRSAKSASPRAVISKKAKRRAQHPKSAAKKNLPSKKR
jgi:S1 RNA binding domain